MDSGGNYRRGAGTGVGHGRGRGGGGRVNYPSQGVGGRGWDAPQRQFHRQPPAQQEWIHRPPVQGYSGDDQPPSLHTLPFRRPAHQGVGLAAGREWDALQSGLHHQSPAQQQWVHRHPFQGYSGENHPPSLQTSSSQLSLHVGISSAQSHWPSSGPAQTPPASPPRSSSDELSGRPLKIPLQLPVSSSSQSKENQIQPIRRPDKGGTLSVRSIKLLVNHFPVKFDPNKTIFHYHLDVMPVTSNNNTAVKKPLRKSELQLIRDKFFPDDQLKKTAYDGEKNIFSAIHLEVGQFQLNVSDGEDVNKGSYVITIKLVNELRLSKLKEYLRGELSYIPRDILQGMDLILKENPSRMRILVGRSFYSPHEEDNLGRGVAANRGFQQSLKPTSQGLALCLDYSILSFYKPMPVIEYVMEHFPQFKSLADIKYHRREVIGALKGLQVRVTHRLSKQKYTISGLAEEDTCDSCFDLVDIEGNNPPRRISLVSYFRDKWGRYIEYINIPCLELGKNKRSSKVPMELCILVEGQRYPKEKLDKDSALFLKRLTLAKSWVRKETISQMMRANDGPCGEVTKFFNIEVDDNMTKVVGRVIGAPDLKLGGSDSVKMAPEKGQWNLVGKGCLLDGVSIERWALLDFTKGDRFNKLHTDAFVNSLRRRCKSLGIRMEEPLLCHVTYMNEFSDVNRLEMLLRNVVAEASRIRKGNLLQLIVCVMAKRDPGYKFLKWVTETQIGVVTQCCLSSNFNKGKDQELANLCLKINAKLGGSNFELMGKLPHFGGEDHVMFIGADVNHPAPLSSSYPSIAAVVGTFNWPAANRYAARVSPQTHRQEKISNFGNICLELVNNYARHNNVKPSKLVVFRDGVSEGQFGMVLSEELLDLKNAIYDGHYQPRITLIIAQKRHQTRLFPENANDGVAYGNVPPGTVVDSKIVHPFDFDFYLCSHYGSLGTSKPTHYYVLWDENFFTSDELQKLIYDMCFTFVRCTKPVSLVPPVYYADLVAYRGRMFQEAAMETRFTSPASRSSTSSSSTALFDQSFYNLHPDLKNIMFFV